MFDKLIRHKRIVEELNKSLETGSSLSTSTLRNRVNTKIAVPKCKSTYEKDLELLRSCYGIVYTASIRGIILDQKVDFIQILNIILK